MRKIKIGIIGYGNLGQGVVKAIKKNSDMELVAIFSRRAPEKLGLSDKTVKAINILNVLDFKDKIDVMIICGSSSSDLPEQTPSLVKHFNVVDSFDTHALINQHFENVDTVAQTSRKIGIIAVGWDPGLFSINRLYSEAVLPDGRTETFWGPGVSQGHSAAVRNISGVTDAVQYTIPNGAIIAAIRSGESFELTPATKHSRVCYVAAEEGADLKKIEQKIKKMPDYFDGYVTSVHFISSHELHKNHKSMPHGGFVIRTEDCSAGGQQVIEYSLKLQSNPDFTASVLVSYARAAYRLSKSGLYGAKTAFDIAPGLVSIKNSSQLREELL